MVPNGWKVFERKWLEFVKRVYNLKFYFFGEELSTWDFFNDIYSMHVYMRIYIYCIYRYTFFESFVL